MNIVRINETIFNTFNTNSQCGFCWSYTYARKDYANLKGDKDKCCVHAYLESFTEETNYRDNIQESISYNFTLHLLLDSLIDIQMFNELEPDIAKSKFSEYVEPLLDCFKHAYAVELCSLDLEPVRIRINAEYNKKDQNKDGIRCQITVRSYD